MKFVDRILCFMITLCCATLAYAANPADNVIKNALADIQRFEQQANGLTPARSSNAKRILKLLEISHERLEGSTNKDDPSWKEVNQRFVALKGQLEGLMNGTATPTQTAKPTSPAKPAANSTQSAQSNSAIPELVSGQRVRVKKLARDIASVRSGIVTTGPSSFQDANEVAARQKSLKQFEEAIARYPQVDDPDVQAARKEFDALRQALSAEFKRAKDQLAQLGDVQKSLATMEANARAYAVPQALAIPFTQEQALQWVEAASNARTVAEHNQKQLAIIAPIAYLPNNPGVVQSGAAYDANDVNRMQRNAADMLKRVEQGYADTSQQLKNRFKQMETDVLGRFQEDPNSDKRYRFIAEGAKEEAFKVYDEGIDIAQSFVYLEQALGRDAKEGLDMIAKIDQAKKEFLKKREIALNTSKLPEAKSKDKKLIAIAEEILKNPKYKYGKFGKIVLTTDQVVERERKDSEIEIDDAEVTLGGDLKMSGTETTWTYKWQEFKFAVPLKETDSDEWYIWWITAKNFSSGGSKTPLNKWVSGQATKGNPILKKNM